MNESKQVDKEVLFEAIEEWLRKKQQEKELDKQQQSMGDI